MSVFAQLMGARFDHVTSAQQVRKPSQYNLHLLLQKEKKDAVRRFI